MENFVSHSSVFSMRMKLHQMVSDGIVGIEVLNQLLLDGELVTYERELWDFKAELPLPPTKIKPSDEEKNNYDAKICEIIKDVVSFYNSFGGYLIIGVSDTPKKFIGWSGNFSCDELNKKIKKYVKHDIETHYVDFQHDYDGKSYRTGLVYIPQRQDDKT